MTRQFLCPVLAARGILNYKAKQRPEAESIPEMLAAIPGFLVIACFMIEKVLNALHPIENILLNLYSGYLIYQGIKRSADLFIYIYNIYMYYTCATPTL